MGEKGSPLFYKSVVCSTTSSIPEIERFLDQTDLFVFDHVSELQSKLDIIVKFLCQKKANTIYFDDYKEKKGEINYIPIFINRYLRKNYYQQLSLITLADMIGCNPTYLSNSYSKIFEIPPMKHLQEIRLKKARYLLLNTDKMIYQIAVEVGYISVSQFISCFKKHYSMSPNKYRGIHKIQQKGT